MTIEYETMNVRSFIKGVNQIYESLGALEQHERSSRANQAKRNAEYAQFTEPLFESCEHKWLLNIPELRKNRDEMLCHLADVVYRSATGIANEGDLTLDDILVISIASFLRKQADDYQSSTLYQAIYDYDIPIDEFMEIGYRFVKYQMSNLPDAYLTDDPDKLENVLMYQFSFGRFMKEYANHIGVNHRVAPDRIKSLRIHERESLLAILYTPGHVEQSIEHSSNAYNSNFTPLSRGKPFAPKPLV